MKNVFTIVSIATVVFLSGCSSSNTTVGLGLQKRKHSKGWYFNGWGATSAQNTISKAHQRRVKISNTSPVLRLKSGEKQVPVLKHMTSHANNSNTQKLESVKPKGVENLSEESLGQDKSIPSSGIKPAVKNSPGGGCGPGSSFSTDQPDHSNAFTIFRIIAVALSVALLILLYYGLDDG